ncbi:hypothetical protein AB4251_18930 [Vibrio lentus]|uniref:Uncharacterized protein n=1 Tax=Vibrio lentus TaxID=136468 RepID=A0AB36XVA4_9VIBR|nr:hypothetical protein [Vibrio lentus]MCC4836761.1 hypothetical protein [Vibrio lentus]PMI16414.1 hypothetical protein BCU51_03235 [Vibrio lentus]PMK35418.1 hypothetical protein BCU02_13580 [Vibrio lentus]PMK49954.1 hypothetical protein BCT99_00660 [Vibrio lentus]PML31609.1 hypothetical protein BCT79_04320 [Vibrio lentus]
MNQVLRIDPKVITESLAKGLAGRLARECEQNKDDLLNILASAKGIKNLQKKCMKFTGDGKAVSGIYLGEKSHIAMQAFFDPMTQKFGGGYVTKLNGKYSFYASDLRFSKHSIERLIERMKPEYPHVCLAHAVNAQIECRFRNEQQSCINLDQVYHNPHEGVDVALPYVKGGKLLGMWFAASIGDSSASTAKSLTAKTFVDSSLLRTEQYRACMEVYEHQVNSKEEGLTHSHIPLWKS